MRSTWCASASNSSLDSAFNFSGRFNVSVATPPLSSRWTRLFIARLLRTIPPSTPERLKQAGGIRIPIGLRLNEGQFSLLVGELCVEYRDQRDCPQFPLAHRKIKRLFGRALGVRACAQGIGIGRQ